MISKEQYKLNSTYNLFLRDLVLWSYLYKKTESEKEQGFNAVKNYEKMINFQESVKVMLPEIELLDRSSIRSYYPLLDDMALIKYFKSELY